MLTKTEKLQHIANWEKSGLSRPAYCRKYKLKYGTFMGWFPKKAANTSSKGQFINLVPSKSNPSPRIKIVLPNGVSIEYMGQLDGSLLQQLAHV